MKKISLFVAALILIANSSYALNIPTGFTMVKGDQGNTQLELSWTVLDSLNLANGDSLFLVDPTDTTIVAYLDSLDQTSVSLTGCEPGKTYTVSVAVDSAAGEAWGISDSVIVTMDAVDVMSDALLRVVGLDVDLGRELFKATSCWSERVDTVEVSVYSTASESLCIYEAWPYINDLILAQGHSDSTLCTVLYYEGYGGGDWNSADGSDIDYAGITDGFWSLVDSLNITSPGVYNTGLLNIAPNMHVKTVIRGNTDNPASTSSNPTSLIFRRNRSR